jgi:branched-chain amino acid transport system ATP-binding protein
MLEVRGATVDYGSTRAVTAVDFDVADGEMVAIVGPNGAGKTSLLNAIVGAIALSRGSVVAHGRDVTGMRADRIARLGVSLVPEGRRVFARLTVEENLLLACAARRNGHTPHAAAEAVLDDFPALAQLRGRRAGTLSGGEQQQLAIARALVTQPSLLLLDEPSLGLAPLAIDAVFGILAELRRGKTTIVLVEQATSRALEVSDRAYLMRDGHLAPLESEDSASLQEAYFGGGGVRSAQR